MRGGVGYRKTADTVLPADTPPSDLVFITNTAAHTYLWDGDGYYLTLDGSSPLPTNFSGMEAVGGTKNGTNLNFTIAHNAVVGSVVLVMNGVTYLEGVDFTRTGTAITWGRSDVVPDSADSFYAPNYRY